MNSIYNRVLILLLMLSLFGCERDSVNNPITDDGVPPNSPVGITVWRASDGQIGIEWFKNNELGTSGYNIYRSIGDTSNFKYLEFTSDIYYLDTKLVYDSSYFYKVKTLDIFDNESAFSLTVSATPKNRFYPSTPFDIRINARNWNDSIYIYLNWFPTGDTDIEFYEVYRGTNPEVEIDTQFFHGITNHLNFSDCGNVKILTQYYYRIVAVDQGGLKSEPTRVMTDIIFNKPGVLSPQDGSEISTISGFEIKLVSKPAEYRIVLQKNKYFDIIKEIDFYTEEIDINKFIALQNISLEPYREYYWRIITYSDFSSEPNSFTDLNKFTIAP